MEINLHPETSHFPIALLAASFLFDLLGFVAKSDSLRLSGRYCLILAAIGAVAAYFTGLHAAVDAQTIPEIGNSLAIHRSAALMTLRMAMALVVIRIVLILRYSTNRLGMIFYLFLAMVVLLSILRAGYTGTELVRRFGAGVDPVARTIERRQQEVAPAAPTLPAP